MTEQGRGWMEKMNVYNDVITLEIKNIKETFEKDMNKYLICKVQIRK